MTQAELLNYILEKEKLKKEDLAKLLGIRRKNIEKIFNGEMELTKRQIKYASEFTLLPQEVIKSGEVVLPDLENTGVVFIDEEWVKNQNTKRFEDFIKSRFKIPFISLFLLKLSIYFILIFLSIFAGSAFYSAFSENIEKSTAFSAFFTLIPYLLGFASIVPMFKVIKKANFNEVKRVKIYYYFIIVANLISLMGLVALNANHWVFFVMGLFCTLIPLVFLILENNRKSNEKRMKILSTVLIFISSLALQIVPEYIKYLETDREFYFGIIFIGLNLVLVVAHICYWGIKDLSEFSNKFQMLNDKKCFKKRKVLRSLVSVLLVTTIVAGSVHFSFLYIIKTAMTEVFLAEYEYKPYSEYTKQNVVFTDEDKTVTLENGNFTYKIPEGLLNTTKDEGIYITYRNEEGTIMISSNYAHIEEPFGKDMMDKMLTDNADDIEFPESLKIMLNKLPTVTEEVFLEKYGICPDSLYKFYKLEEIINQQEINYWDKTESFCHIMPIIMYINIIPNFEQLQAKYLFETEETVGLLYCTSRKNDETGKTQYNYIYEFSKSSDAWFDGQLMIFLPEELASTDLAYKIINSVEMK
ncbi:MAG: hypothetical protein E7557_04050 [Ruminococcaceae bacterium]|nr:hypothetical protein [Oscillospiraceae bacterium]